MTNEEMNQLPLPTYANSLMVLLTLVKPPRFVFDRLLRGVRGVSEEQKLYPRIFLLLHVLYLCKRGFSHLRFMDFTRVPGRIAWLCWKVGLVGFWYRRVLRKFNRETSAVTNPVSARSVSAAPATMPPQSLPFGSMALPVIEPAGCGSLHYTRRCPRNAGFSLHNPR